MTAPSTADWMRPLGSTGLRVSAVCLGAGPLGNMAEPGDGVAGNAPVELVQAVLASPLRMMDTSNGYGDGASERRIGAGIAAYGGLPEDVVVATKVDARGRDYSGERVRASVAESKERLGLDVLPLVYLHDPEYHDFDDISAPGGAVATLMALRDEGVIGHVGLAGGEVHEMSRYLALGGFEVLLVHNRWTLVDRSATELLDQAEDLGVAIVNAAVYGGGMLADPSGGSRSYGYRPATPETLRAVEAMDAACREAGTDLSTAALQASVDDPRVSTTVVGFSKPGRIEHLVTGLEQELPTALFDTLAGLLPSRSSWLDFQAS